MRSQYGLPSTCVLLADDSLGKTLQLPALLVSLKEAGGKVLFSHRLAGLLANWQQESFKFGDTLLPVLVASQGLEGRSRTRGSRSEVVIRWFASYAFNSYHRVLRVQIGRL